MGTIKLARLAVHCEFTLGPLVSISLKALPLKADIINIPPIGPADAGRFSGSTEGCTDSWSKKFLGEKPRLMPVFEC